MYDHLEYIYGKGNHKISVKNICGTYLKITVFFFRFHMKGRHSISQTVITPLNPNKNVFDRDEFIVKPKLVVSALSKDTFSSEPSPVGTSPVENLYMPDDIANIPIRSIFSHEVK